MNATTNTAAKENNMAYIIGFSTNTRQILADIDAGIITIDEAIDAMAAAPEHLGWAKGAFAKYDCTADEADTYWKLLDAETARFGKKKTAHLGEMDYDQTSAGPGYSRGY